MDDDVWYLAVIRDTFSVNEIKVCKHIGYPYHPGDGISVQKTADSLLVYHGIPWTHRIIKDSELIDYILGNIDLVSALDDQEEARLQFEGSVGSIFSNVHRRQQEWATIHSYYDNLYASRMK